MPKKPCIGCIRRAALVEFKNLHNPSIETEYEDYKRAFEKYFPTSQKFISTDEYLKAYAYALSKCKELIPSDENTDYIFPSSINTKLTELLVSPCFYLLGKYQIEGTTFEPSLVPEYIFKGSFENNITKGPIGSSNKPIVSRLILNLYFNGKKEELVKSWQTESTITSASSQYNRMFDKSDAELRKNRPIELLLWDFEKRPSKCVIHPEKNIVEFDEEIVIELSDFKDVKGRFSREFNRILVEASNGEIIGGVSSDKNPKFNVFTLENLPIKFKYKILKTSEKNEGIISVYNSCDVLPEKFVPLAKTTTLGKKMAEFQIKVEKVKWSGFVSYHRTVNYKSTLLSTLGDVTVKNNEKLVEDAAFNFNLKYTHSYNTQDYYEVVGNPQGSYSFEIELIKDVIYKTGTETTIQKSADSGALGPYTGKGDKGQAKVLLIIDHAKNTYKLEINIGSPTIKGTEKVISGGKVLDRPPTLNWSIYAITFFEGQTDGKKVNGAKSYPASEKGSLIQPGGLGGSEWNWTIVVPSK